MEIQEVTIDEAELIIKIISASFLEQAALLGLTRQNCPKYVAFETLEDLKRRHKEINENLVIGFEGGEPIGTIRYNKSTQTSENGFINRLAVLPAFRGRNFGRELMNYAEEQLRINYVKKVEISIVSQFESLKRYYHELGYKSIGDRKFDLFPFEVHFMEKLLNIE
jgi:predicted GNAT family N-acyltransferase